jgi:deoxynucleoside triphosphate triphosphohydrolase SAMHD1
MFPNSTALASGAMTPSHGRSNDMAMDHANNNGSNGRHLMICYPTKMVKAAMGFFTKRFSLHSKVYQHKTTAAVGHQINDILCLADPYFFLPTMSNYEDDNGNHNELTTSGTRALAKAKRDHRFLPCSRAMLDASVMLRCRDSIIDQIANTTDPKLQPARNLVYRLWKRDLYKCVATKHINMKDHTDCAIWKREEEDIVREMMALGGRHGMNDNGNNKGQDQTQQEVVRLHEDDFIVERCSMHHGCKDKNPLSKMRFLPKHLMHKLVAADINDLPEAIEEDESTYEALLPRLLQENSIRVYSVHANKSGLVSHVFSAWLEHIKSLDDDSPGPLNTTPELDKEEQERVAMLSQDSDMPGAYKNENGKTPPPSGWSSVVSPPLQKHPRMT